MARQVVRQMARPLLSIPLIGGAALTIWNDQLEAGGPVFLVRDLTNAGLVTMPAGRSGQPVRPAIGIWDRRGRYAFYVPADPADAPRAVETLYQVRPDLRAQGIPRAVAGPGVRNVEGTQDNNERVLAGIAHLSVLFAPLLMPLIIWMAAARGAPYASRQARQAFLFHLSILALDALIAVVLLGTVTGAFFSVVGSGSLGGLGVGVLAVLVGGLIIIALTLAGLGYSLFAAIEAFQGRPFSYPLLRRF